MNNQILKGAIFDLDGTVMDSNGAWDGCGLAVLKKWGYQPKPTLVEDLFPLGAGDIVRFLKQEYAMTQSLEEIYQAMLDYMRQVYAEQVQLKSGVREVLLQLKAQGVPLVMATATVRECVMPALQRTGLDQIFDHVLNCDDVGHSKEEPHIFLEAMRRMGTQPENTWLFEDAIHAIRTGHSLGLVVCAIEDPAGEPNREEIRAKSNFYLTDWAQWAQLPVTIEP